MISGPMGGQLCPHHLHDLKGVWWAGQSPSSRPPDGGGRGGATFQGCTGQVAQTDVKKATCLTFPLPVREKLQGGQAPQPIRSESEYGDSPNGCDPAFSTQGCSGS